MNSLPNRRVTAAELMKWVSSASLAVSPLILLAMGMEGVWWIPGVFAWPAVVVYVAAVRTHVGIWVAGILLLAIASYAWGVGLLGEEEFSLLAVYLFYPYLAVVAVGAALTDFMYRTIRRRSETRNVSSP